jgi:hypothetical protein
MSKLTALIATLGIIAAPVAFADDAQLELQPKNFRIEHTLFVADDGGSRAAIGPTSEVSSGDAFYNRGTGGVSPQ